MSNTTNKYYLRKAFKWYTTSDLIFLYTHRALGKCVYRKIKSRVGYSRYTTRKPCITNLSHIKPLSSHWNIGRPPEIYIFPCPWRLFPVGSSSVRFVVLQPQLIFFMLFSAFLGSFFPEVVIEGNARSDWQSV